MGRKHTNGRRRFVPGDSDLALEFNSYQPLDIIHDMLPQLDIDPVEFLYTVLVLGTLAFLFLPSLAFIIASL